MSNILNGSNLLNQFNIQQGDLLDANSANINLGRFSSKFDRESNIGFNGTVDNTEYILSPNAPVNGLDISFPASAVNFSIASTSANDTSAGTGARTVILIGLDANYNTLLETVTLTGQAPVDTNNTFLRVNDIIVTSVGSTGSNEGNIYCSDSADTFTAGEPNTRIYAAIQLGDNISKTLTYTVPNGFILAPKLIRLNTTATTTTTAEIRFLRQSSAGVGVFLLTERYYIGTGGAIIDISNSPAFTPKTDVKMTAVRATGNGTIAVHANFEGVLLRQY